MKKWGLNQQSNSKYEIVINKLHYNNVIKSQTIFYLCLILQMQEVWQNIIKLDIIKKKKSEHLAVFGIRKYQ